MPLTVCETLSDTLCGHFKAFWLWLSPLETTSIQHKSNYNEKQYLYKIKIKE